MALTKVTGKGLDNNVVDSTKLSTNSVTETKIASGAVTSAKILDGDVSADDLASSLDLSSKTVTLPTTSVTAAMLSSTLDLSSKTVTLPPSATATLDQNIALLGFKMAVTDGLTVFNLVDGVVDEFEDESGVDNSASTSLNYCATSDFYINQSDLAYSAAFTTSTITEPDTSVAGTNPGHGLGTFGTFTVPAGMTSLNIQLWGSGGGAGSPINPAGFGASVGGGGGGYSEGTLAVSPSQVLHVVVGEGGNLGGPTQNPSPETTSSSLGFGGKQNQSGLSNNGQLGGGGGGLSGLFDANPFSSAPQAFLISGSGGGGSHGGGGGAGGGTTGDAGGSTTEQSQNFPHPNGCRHGGGGGQSVGGQGGSTPTSTGGTGFLFNGGPGNFPGTAVCTPGSAGGGAGYYGGGGGAAGSRDPAAGGGSSYIGNPQITSGSTEEGGSPDNTFGGGTSQPGYSPGTNEGVNSQNSTGEDGFVLLTGNAQVVSSSTIISDPFTSTTVPTSARIVVFEENVGTPSLNTDIIASISRNNGTNFTTATLTDSGYVTGSSGQRILTGTATISGQPSGQSMRWKLELANNTVKIHGVALQWK